MRRCVYRKQLDLETLVCTRGPNFPLSRLESRLMCPSCGSRSVTDQLRDAQVGRAFRPLIRIARALGYFRYIGLRGTF
jgi:hypothetical protein